jgi:hypothetical protein
MCTGLSQPVKAVIVQRAAAQAWGADRIFEEILQGRRKSSENTDDQKRPLGN